MAPTPWGQGDFSKQVEIRSNDECGDLADSFNQMTSNLQTSRQQIEETVKELEVARNAAEASNRAKIGRASCRER